MYASEHNAAAVSDAPDGVVVLAASFGGLSALRTVLSGLLAELPVPLVVVLHRSADSQDRVAELLAARSAIPVHAAGEGYRLAGGCAAVLPAGRQGRLRAGGIVELGPAGRPSADVVLRDAADVYGSAVLAVVLTGKLSDGAAGVRAVKRAGGIALAQDPDDSAAPGMPTAALSTGCVDHRLPLRMIAPAIVTMTMAPGGAQLLRVPAAPWASLGATAG